MALRESELNQICIEQIVPFNVIHIYGGTSQLKFPQEILYKIRVKSYGFMPLKFKLLSYHGNQILKKILTAYYGT